MNLLTLFLSCVCLLVGYTSGATPVIQNPGGTANLKEKQNVDICVHLLITSPKAFSCSQTTSSFAEFALQKRTGDTDYCVYFLANQGTLALTPYTVSFTCDDGAGNTDSSSVVINIDPNAPPTFTEGSTVTETVDASAIKTGNTLFTATATDPDSDPLVFTLDQTFAEFYIDPPTGDVKAKVDFDTLTTTPYTFKVRVSDSYHTAVEQDVTIILINMNTPPSITNLLDPLQFPEDTAPGTVLYTCSHDETGPVNMIFTVTPNIQRFNFNFNPANCEISLKAGKNLDFETISTMTMNITLDDGVLTQAFPFTFEVQDVNEPPTFASNSYTMNIKEGPLPLTPTIQPAFVVLDEDSGDSHTFTLGTGTYDSFFTIDGTTGALTCNTELDYDAGITQVTITVIATDSGGESASTTLTVNVADYNDNDPEFSTSTTLYISPKTPVGKIGEIVGTDKDTGNNAKLTYNLFSDSSGGKFLVQPDGSVFLKTPVTEAERNDVYSVVARATDGGNPARTADTTISIVFDPVPVITNLPDIASISEDTSGKKDVFKIEVTDNDTFVCVADKVTPSTTEDAFVVEKKTGGTEWFVFYTGLEPLSFTTIPSFTVDVICTDANGGSSVTRTLTINVGQNAPPVIDCTQTEFDVDASTTTIGDLVHTVTATDTDTLTYQMTLLPSPGTFTMDTSGKIICQRQMIREAPTQYIGAITVSDVYNTVSCTITFTMINTNEAPTFSNLPKSVSVAEDVAGGTSITDVTISDALECAPTSFVWDVNPVTDLNKFDVTLANKVITVSLAADQQLDHETVEEYSFTFRANDGCLDSQIYPLYLTVTDVNEPPEFLNGDFFVVYFNEIGSPGANLGCGGWDPDALDSHMFTLSGAQANLFSLTDTSQCYIRPILELDRDKAPTVPANFKLTMIMADAAGLKTTATVSVIVNEVNDNDPVCTQPAFTFADIFNSDMIGRTLGTVTATDDDVGVENSQLTYSIVSPSFGTNVVDCTSDGKFRLIADPEGKLIAPGSLLDFTVKVTDGGTPSRSTTCKVNLQYIYTTTPPPPPTPVPTVATAAAATAAAATTAASGTSGTTLSSVEQALSNPVVLGLIAALGTLAALAAIVGLVCCCKYYGPCQGGSGAKATKGYDYRNNGPSRLQSRSDSQPRRWSPKNNKVSSDITRVSEAKPNVNNDPTTMKYL